MDELIEAVEALTKVRNVQIPTDDGPKWVTGDPRLQILQDEVYASTGSGGGSGGLKSERLPLSSHVLYKAAVITAQIADWCRMENVPVTRDPITDLEAWCQARLSNPERPDDWHIQQLRNWAGEIDAMFTRPKVFDIAAPCPVCKAKTYTDDDGDVCALPLKGIEDSHRVECRACGEAWEGLDAAEELADELGITPV